MMKEIRRPFLSPQSSLSQSKRAPKTQRFPHNAMCETPQDISRGLFMPSASFLQAFPAAHGELQSSGGRQSLSLPSSPWGSAWAQNRSSSGVCSPVGSLGLVCSCCRVYLPPSKSRWPCLPLASGFWKLWPDCLFVLQPHTRPYFSQSGDSSSESVATREAAQSREAETAGCGSSTPRSLWFSGPAQQTAKAGWSPTSPPSPPGAAGASPRPEQRRAAPRPPRTMPLQHPEVKPNPLRKANLCSRLFLW